MGDEALMPGRVYGADHDDPDLDPGPQPGRVYRELVGGPLDGRFLDVTGMDDRQLADGAALITEIGSFGSGSRAPYEPWHAPHRSARLSRSRSRPTARSPAGCSSPRVAGSAPRADGPPADGGVL